MNRIYVLHENNEWVKPLRSAFDRLDLPFREWFLHEGKVSLDEEPPEGVFYNRMSASSHTRVHRDGPELTHLVLNWLESYNRRVVNNSRALSIEVSKIAQYGALRRAGIRIPETVAAVGHDEVVAAARDFRSRPFILKPNRGGKGLGVILVETVADVSRILKDPSTAAPLDGVWLLQEYVRSPDRCIIRSEFVGGRYLYSVRVDTSSGFELCPADVCEPGGDGAVPNQPTFSITRDYDNDPIINRYQRFLAENGIEIAGIEFIVDQDGLIHTYDVNTNTNYNADAEARADVRTTGMQAIAEFLGSQLV